MGKSSASRRGRRTGGWAASRRAREVPGREKLRGATERGQVDGRLSMPEVRQHALQADGRLQSHMTVHEVLEAVLGAVTTGTCMQDSKVRLR